jgi:hypothetical protein
MARFRCRACGREGTFEYDERRRGCTMCGSRDMQVALAIEEVPPSIIDAIRRLADEHDEYDADDED